MFGINPDNIQGKLMELDIRMGKLLGKDVAYYEILTPLQEVIYYELANQLDKTKAYHPIRVVFAGEFPEHGCPTRTMRLVSKRSIFHEFEWLYRHVSEDIGGSRVAPTQEDIKRAVRTAILDR